MSLQRRLRALRRSPNDCEGCTLKPPLGRRARIREMQLLHNAQQAGAAGAEPAGRLRGGDNFRPVPVPWLIGKNKLSATLAFRNRGRGQLI